MRQTWRWFGPDDPVSISDLMQAGVEGVVSALHFLPPGVVWPIADIRQRQTEIGVLKGGSKSGLQWEVVESLPVSEDIKRQTGDWKAHLVAYTESLTNLHAAGIDTVCYNFMPILDWTRTDLAYRLSSGATCMRFDLVDFAVFDINILGRSGASKDFPEEVVVKAQQRAAEISEDRRKELSDGIVSGLPGAAETLTLDDLRDLLEAYDGISPAQLRANLVDFLSEVAPHAQSLGMRLCCHPDDPPFSLLGLPRVMSTEADYRKILDAVDLPANGITLCSGSLGSRPDNDLPAMMERLGDRVHFLHLRNVQLESQAQIGSFHESEHLGGSTDMVALISEVLREERKRRAKGRPDAEIPFRPDHGQNILDDHTRQTQPGYPAIGRLKGLAELRGIVTALDHPIEGIVS